MKAMISAAQLIRRTSSHCAIEFTRERGLYGFVVTSHPAHDLARYSFVVTPTPTRSNLTFVQI
jgi:hypothetical protein